MYCSFKCSTNITSIPFSCEIWGSHSADCEDCCVLGCNALSSPFAFGQVQVCYIQQIFSFYKSIHSKSDLKIFLLSRFIPWILFLGKIKINK
jgi:hypothetical protein